MKNALLQNLTLLGLIAAALVLPVNAAAAGIAFAVSGVLAILFADYGRDLEPLCATARVVPFKAHEGAASDLRDAA